MQESGASWHEFFLVDSAVPNNLQLVKFNQVPDPRFKYSLSLKGALVVARKYEIRLRLQEKSCIKLETFSRQRWSTHWDIKEIYFCYKKDLSKDIR